MFGETKGYKRSSRKFQSVLLFSWTLHFSIGRLKPKLWTNHETFDGLHQIFDGGAKGFSRNLVKTSRMWKSRGILQQAGDLKKKQETLSMPTNAYTIFSWTQDCSAYFNSVLSRLQGSLSNDLKVCWYASQKNPILNVIKEHLEGSFTQGSKTYKSS